MYVTQNRKDRIKDVMTSRQYGLTVVMEDIHDRYNLEAVMRSCEAFGIQDVHVIFEHHPPYKIKRRSTSSSGTATKWLSVHTSESTATTLQQLKADGYVICVTMIDHDA